jgi:hypothetical protein
MRFILYTMTVLALSACSGKKKESSTTVSNTISSPASTNPTSSVKPKSDAPVLKNELLPDADTWKYEKTVDKTGSTVYKASITSPTRLQFGFPYTGGSTATLTLRKRDDLTTVYLQITNGQFNRSFQGGKVRIRFDDKPAVVYSYSAAENGRANIIFFDAEQKLVNQLKAARSMVIDVEFYAQGRRQISFRTAGLRWNH